jgi:DUF2914 family protein
MSSFPKVGFIAYVCFAIASVTGAATAEPQAKSLGVKRLVLAHGIDGHEPQEATSSFRANNDRVYAFVEVSNNTKSEGTIHVVFLPPTGPALAEIPLKVGDGPRFRTWAFTRKVHEAGEWAVVVRDDHGKLLGRQSFTVAK